MGTSVACYYTARRPGAPGNTHAKRKRTAGGAVLSLPTPAARGQRCREENEMDHDTFHEINT